jgi:DNA-binding SARP family transcriptional activator
VYLTGGLRVEGPNGAFADGELPGSQGRLALAALVVERRPLSRAALAELVWDGRPPPQWNGALSTVISKIRTLVTATGLDGRDVLVSGSGTYSMHLPPGTWVDREDAYRRLDRADGALRHDDPVTATSEATVAGAILRRGFLPGIDARWADDVRRDQHDALHRCWVVLAEGWNRRGDHGLAATVARRAIEIDPLREVGHRLLMEAEWGRGDRGAALRALARCQQVLADELGATPSPETQRLAATMQR